MTKWQKFKDWCKSVRRHKKLYFMLVVMALVLIRVIHQNYDLQQPIVNKRSETFMQVWNERATCLQELEIKKNVASSINEDIMQ